MARRGLLARAVRHKVRSAEAEDRARYAERQRAATADAAERRTRARQVDREDAASRRAAAKVKTPKPEANKAVKPKAVKAKAPEGRIKMQRHGRPPKGLPPLEVA